MQFSVTPFYGIGAYIFDIFTSAPGLRNNRPVVITVSPLLRPVTTCTLD